ncbi:Hpt domain-containing protein [Idiomarina sp. HP20-50]|uniref:Hpt domain-containing protein n=1 Tax=Idiomarina sp. HP20-50 TaxID=3070813 RepID=UPI00294B3224|nr:Hpt domain-containing protein [Idiomarina sp. HP20-50]MDV6316068.1 Hpt domain-containing protein [Idiomarina sp. HP20-50]
MSSDFTQIDFNRGLRHCDGQHELYREVLACYLDQFRPLLSAETLLDNYDSARLELHTLKSLSATVGAAGLSDLAAQLFKDWQQKDPQQRSEAIRQVNSHLTIINNKIEAYCKQSALGD